MSQTRDEQRKAALRLFSDIMKGKDTSQPLPAPKPAPKEAPRQPRREREPERAPQAPAPETREEAREAPSGGKDDRRALKKKVSVRNAPDLPGEPKRRSRAALAEERRAKREEELALAQRRQRELQAARRAPARSEEGERRRPVDPALEGAAAKRAEEQRLRERRASEVYRAAKSDGRWMTPEMRSGQRSMPRLNEPSLEEKIAMTLGEPVRRDEGKGIEDARRRGRK